MFKITGGKGFHITFENGYTVSVQFGPGNYCDNYDRPIIEGRDVTTVAKAASSCGERGSTTAECAVWARDKDLIAHKSFDGNNVSNRSTPAEVLKLLNWAARQKSTNPKPEV